jgi:hypothetical protein
MARLQRATGMPAAATSEVMRRRWSISKARLAAPGAPAFVAIALTCLMLWIPSRATGAAGDEIYTQPGRLVAIDGTRLNIYCMGSGSPTVVLD